MIKSGQTVVAQSTKKFQVAPDLHRVNPDIGVNMKLNQLGNALVNGIVTVECKVVTVNDVEDLKKGTWRSLKQDVTVSDADTSA